MTQVKDSARFAPLWAAQTLSMSCQGLTSFALGVWVFLKTGSATRFALVEVAAVLPGLLALPFAGALIDRLGPRRALLLSDVWGFLIGLILAALFLSNVATPELLLVVLIIRNFVTAIHWPSYTAATTMLVGPERVARSGALMQVGYIGQQVLAPAIAGLLLGRLGMAGILIVDVVSFLLALLVTFAARIPQAAPSPATSLFEQIGEAFRFADRRGLLRLAAYTATTYLPGGFVVALSTPLLLSVTTPRLLGLTSSFMGSGMLLGSLFAARFVRNGGGMSRMLRYDALLALSMIGVGLVRSPAAIAIMGFLFLFGLAGMLAEEQALWQVRVPAEVQGRVFALRRLITFASLPVSYLLAGPLADRVFAPLVAGSAYRASSLGVLLGSDAGRGMALLVFCGGLLKVAIILSSLRSRRLRSLDTAA